MKNRYETMIEMEMQELRKKQRQEDYEIKEIYREKIRDLERDIEIKRENETRYLTEMGKMMDRIEQLERELVLAKMKEFMRGH
jgi:predicted  nucleic acid-binding Zn-ribbon protein